MSDKNNYKFFKLTPGHIPEIIKLENIIFPCPWTEDMFDYEINADHSNFFVLINNEEKIAGYFGLWVVQDEGHINNFAVTPEYRRQGIADFMMKKIFKIGKEKKIAIYYLEVRISNHKAINLYKKHGFFEAGVRRNYYSSPREDALLMTKIL